MRTAYAILAWLVVAGISSLGFAQTRPNRPAEPVTAAVVALRGEINEFNQNAFVRHFNQAKAAGAKVIIVDLDTYGGMVRSGLELSHFLKTQTDVHTIAYVDDKAISAGAMIALACDEIVMARFAKLGDCAPISVGSDGQLQPLPETERAKFESPILNDFAESAREHGYDENLVLSMVSVKRTVYWVQNPANAQRKFVDEAEYKQLTAKGWTPVPGVPNPIDGPDTLLTVDTSLAIKLGLAKGEADTRETLAMQRNLIVGDRVYETGVGEQILALLNNGAVRGILLGIFLTCLYMALHAPGHGFAEVLAAVTLAILLGVPLLTGYAQWWEIVVILIGVGLLALELFVIPGFGITGFVGIAMILVGFLLTFIAPEPGRSPLSVPHMQATWESLKWGLIWTTCGLISSFLLSWWLRRYLPKMPYFNRLILNTTVGGSETAMAGSLSNIEPTETSLTVGATGKAMTDLRPGGSAQFLDPAGAVHVLSVVSDSGFVGAGTKIVVREVQGNRIVVRAEERKN